MPSKDAMAVLFALQVIAHVFVSVGKGKDTLSGTFTLDIMAFVCIAVLEFIYALSVLLVLGPFA
jgi:hypothetical protein